MSNIKKRSRKEFFRKEPKVKRGSLAISQIIILLVSLIAFSYFVGSEFRIVSAEDMCLTDKKGVLFTPGGNPVKVGAWSPEQINQWCDANGGRDSLYCTWVGSGVYKLGEKTFPCQTQSATTPSEPPFPPVPVPRFLQRESSADTTDNQGQNQAQTGNKVCKVWIDEATCGEYEKPKTETPVEKTARLAKETAEAAVAKRTAELAALKGNWGKLGTGVLQNAVVAASIYGGVKWFVTSVLKKDSDTAEAFAKATSAGYFAVSTARTIASFFGQSIGVGLGIAIGAVAVIAVLLLFTGKERQKTIAFSCYSWDAPTGGSNCEKCNNEEFPCTEYRCRSLGQQCEIANKGTTEELCVYVNRLDTNPPVIQPWIQVLTNGYNYSPDNRISPPDRGVKIVPTGNVSGCVAPFTPLKFGITLNQPAKCKIDANNTANFSDMDIFLSSGRSRYNHSFQMSLPSNGSLAAENITLQNGGKITIYTRCQNAAGRINVANFIFNFCVDQGPDRTPPNIVTTSILNGMPIAFGQESVDLQIFVNEPSECRWSHSDKTYDDMISDNNMTCATGVLQYNDQQLYQCSTTLTGLRDRVDNDFYFKCLDQPHLKGTGKSHERNEGPSYPFTLKGTEALVISSVAPNNTIIKDSTNVIKVTINATTSAGADEGKAICSFKNTATDDESVEFFNTGTHKHSQDLYLTAGAYNFLVSCVDLGGNSDTKLINFTVETDTQAPAVVRVFRQENKLKVITTEESQCVYGNFGCDYLFKDGTNMSKAVNGTEHSTAWDTNKIFYIKCSDKFGNQPFPNQCNIVAKPFEIPGA